MCTALRRVALFALLAAGLWIATAAHGQWVFYPTDDTFIAERQPGENYGYADYLSVRNREGATPGWERDTLLKFDLSIIPPGTPITLATLSIYYYRWGDNNPSGRVLSCHRALHDWEEHKLTWSYWHSWGHPCAPEPTASAVVPNQYGWMTWDVTVDVQAFVAGTPNFGWEIRDLAPFGGYNIPITDFYSKESGSLRPYLTVVPEPSALAWLTTAGVLVAHARRPSRTR